MIESWPMITDALIKAGAIKESVDAWMIAQGAYSHGSLSADTHAGGGAMDVWWSLVDTDAKVRAWRSCGIAMWPRTEVDSVKFGGSNRHGHGLWIGCPHLSPGAASQVVSFRNGRDGLIGNRIDRWARLTPSPIITWQQAHKRWTSTASGGPTGPSITKGLLDMAGTIRRHDAVKGTKAQVGKWTMVKLNKDGDVSLAIGPGNVLATVDMSAPIPAGGTLQGRFVVDLFKAGQKTKRGHSYPVCVELGKTGGSSFGNASLLIHLDDDKDGWSRRLRFEVIAYDTKSPITLGNAEFRALKES